MRAIDTGLYTVLNTDCGTAMGTVTGSLNNLGASGAYRWVAPQTGTAPYVVFNEQAGVTAWTFNAQGWRSTVYQVQAVNSGHSGSVALAMSDRFDTLLNDKPLTLSGYTCHRIRREADVEYTEESEGVLYHHVGGLYRIDFS
jgi:hypothetical protein